MTRLKHWWSAKPAEEWVIWISIPFIATAIVLSGKTGFLDTIVHFLLTNHS